jgi:hypothetical protein
MMVKKKNLVTKPTKYSHDAAFTNIEIQTTKLKSQWSDKIKAINYPRIRPECDVGGH